MRHLLGLLLALVMAAALFFAASWGYTQLAARHATALTSPSGLAALGAVAGTGLLLGLLLCVPRISPLAAGLPGVVLLAWSAALVVSSRLALRYIPLKGGSFATGFQALLVSGVLALAGMAMIIPLFVPSRWRRHLLDDADADEEELSLPAASGLLS